jgi:hypothetical protein
MIDDDLWMTNVKKEVTYTQGRFTSEKKKVTAAATKK